MLLIPHCAKRENERFKYPVFRTGYKLELKMVASIAMLSPALVRILRMLDLNDFVTLPIWLLFMAALPVYDYRRLKKVHPATWRSTAFLLILIFGGSAFAMSDAWVKLAAALFG